jgi:hypothetical protein
MKKTIQHIFHVCMIAKEIKDLYLIYYAHKLIGLVFLHLKWWK